MTTPATVLITGAIPCFVCSTAHAVVLIAVFEWPTSGAWLQRIEAGDHIEEFLVDAGLA